VQVPFIDLRAQYRSLREEIRAAIEQVLESQCFVLGPEIAELEEALAGYCGVRFGVGVASGTDALLLSLMALGVGPGDEVITSPYTFFATAGSISRLGAVPVFVDIEAESFNLDPRLIPERLTSRTKVILPVHLFGQCADMQPILELARGCGLAVVEDAAQALGAEYRLAVEAEGRRAGSMGCLGCFSFFPTKNLGGIGEGGMVVTNDAGLAERVRLLRVHGSRQRYHHELIGCNSRLDSIQAAVLLVKLRYLEGWINARQAKAERYGALLAEAGLLGVVRPPKVRYANRHVFSQYVVRTPERDALRKYLAEQGVGTEVYYPIPLHLQECYCDLGYQVGDFPQAEAAAESSLALPIYPELTEEMQVFVVEKMAEFFQAGG